MAVAAFLAGAAQRDVLHDGDIVFHHRGLADHDAGGMVDHDAAADLARPDGCPPRKAARCGSARTAPWPCGPAARANGRRDSIPGRESLCRRERRRDRNGRRDRARTRPTDRRAPPAPISGSAAIGFLENLAHRQRAEIFAAQLLGQVIGQRLLQPVMLQDGGMDEAGQAGSRSAMASASLAQRGPRSDRSSPLFRGVWPWCLLCGRAFTTEACRISKRAEPALFLKFRGPALKMGASPHPSKGPRYPCRQETGRLQPARAGGADLLLSRRSGSAKAMGEPGPSKKQLADILQGRGARARSRQAVSLALHRFRGQGPDARRRHSGRGDGSRRRARQTGRGRARRASCARQW